jgi:hypothetical protein
MMIDTPANQTVPIFRAVVGHSIWQERRLALLTVIPERAVIHDPLLYQPFAEVQIDHWYSDWISF